MDVMRDLATPLPVLVIAEMMGVPDPDRHYIRELAEKLLYIGRGEHDRMKLWTEGMKGMIDYVSPWSTSASATRATISSRSWRAAKRRASSPGIRCSAAPRSCCWRATIPR